MPVNDTDKLLVNDGSKTETITFAQFKDGTVLNDSDKFLINDGTKTETITWAEIEDELGPKGTVDTPTVLKPEDGAGSGTERDLLTDKITAVDGGGSYTCETDTIQKVTNQTATTYSYKYGADQGTSLSAAELINWDDGVDLEIRPIGAGPLDSRTPSVMLYEVGELSVWGVDSAPGTDENVSIWESDDGNNWEYKGDFSQFDLSVNDGRGFVSTKNYLKVYGLGGFTVNRWFVYDAKNAIVLSFPTNNNLDCFEIGDVVQGSNFVSNVYPEGGTWQRGAEQAFDGLYTSFGANAGGGKYVYWEPGDLSGHFIFWRYKAQPDSIITVYYNDGSSTDYTFGSSEITTSPDGVTDCVKCDIGQQSNVEKFGVRHGSSQGADWVGVQLDGVTLVTSEEVKVISKKDDEAPYQITVDGGEWAVGSEDATSISLMKWEDQCTGVVFNTVDYPLSKAFDGNISGNYVNGTRSDANGLTCSPRKADGSKFTANQVKLYVFTAGLTENIATINGFGVNDSVDGAAAEKEFTYSLNGAELDSINWRYVENNDYVYLKGIELDGKLLVSPGGSTTVTGKTTSWNSSLTVAGTKDLDVLNVGDVVKMGLAADVPYQPVSDAITSVNPIIYSGNVTNTATLNRPATESFDGDENTWAQTGGQDAVNDYFLTYNFPEGLKINQQLRVWAYSNTAEQFANLTFADGSTERVNIPHSAGEGSAERKWVTLFTGKKTLSKIDVERKKTGSINSQDVIGYAIIEVDGIALVDGQSKLTLAGDTDLAYFREGDEAQSVDNKVPSIETLSLPDKQTGTKFTYSTGLEVTSLECISNAYGGSSFARVIRLEFLDGTKITTDNIGTTYTISGKKYATNTSWEQTLTTGAETQKGAQNAAEKQYRIDFDSPVLIGSIVMFGDYLGDPSSPYHPINLVINDSGNALEPIIVDEVKIVSISKPGDTNHPSITVTGGEWSGTDGSGEATGDTEVTCVSPLKEPTDWTVERIEGTTIDVSHATPDDNAQVWVADDNQAGKEFVINGGKYIDEPLLTSNVELQSSQFATTPADVDGLKEIIWSLNDVEQSAGTLNPYKPTGLALNTEYRVKVKHLAQNIGESQWSQTTTFFTGASRSLKEHYVRQIRELRTALAEAGEPRALSVEDESPRKRARNADGTYRGDDPSTPDVNEAWEDS